MPQTLSVYDCFFAYDTGDFCLQSVSLDVGAGSICGIIGPNGSGKSTLLRIVAGIARPSAGRVSVAGKDLRSFTRLEFARKVAFLPQNPSPAYDLTVREVVGLGRYPYQRGLGFPGKDDARVIERTLRDTDCRELAGRMFSTLSGGERQRVLVASVLAQEPALLLLDEPGASLDIHHKSHVFDLLWLLSRSGIAVVVVTHDLNMAGEFCDTLLLLSGGRVAGCGRPDEVMTDSLLSETYKADLRVLEHPLTGSPMVSVTGRKVREKAQVNGPAAQSG